ASTAAGCTETPTQAERTPASLVVVSGANQSDTVAQQLAVPLGVRVLTNDGGGVPGVVVRFQATGDGNLSATLPPTDATGVAYTAWSLRTHAGPDTVIATVAVLQGQQAVITATAVPDRLAVLRVT